MHTLKLETMFTIIEPNIIISQPHLKQGRHHRVVVKHDAVKRPVDTIVDVVHKGGSTVLRVHRPLAKHVDGESMCGAGKIPTFDIELYKRQVK